ncbi:MAG: energy transducer TonB [Bacteroidota bacterium]
MKPKKSFKADLERRKPLFLKIGLVLALTGVFFAFEWKQTEKEVVSKIPDGWKVGDDLTTISITKPDPPKKIDVIRPTNLFTIVNNSITVENPFEVEFPEGPDIEYVPIIENPEVGGVDFLDTAKIVVDFDATFPGGFGEMQKYFGEHLQYPVDERQIGIQGAVYVNFIVEKSGAISNVSIARQLSYNCDNEAMRVIKMMPKWKPAIDHGKTVRQQFTIPFQFKLN